MATNAFDTNLKGYRSIVGDYTRAYMFKLEIPQLGNEKTVSGFARSTNLPDYTIGNAPIAFQGLNMKVATVAQFDGTWSIEFLADEAQVLRNRVISWLQYVYDPYRMQGTSIRNYKTDNLIAYQLDRSGQEISKYRFYGIFPSKVTGFKFNHSETNPQNFTVTFTYDFFTIDQNTDTEANNAPFSSTTTNGETAVNEASQTGTGSTKTTDGNPTASIRQNNGP